MLKRLIRSGPVQGALGALLAAYMALVARTTRWTVEGQDLAQAAFRAGGGVCVVVWHGRLLLLPACWPRDLVARPALLISQSPDGGFGADAAQRLGADTIRGSTRRADRAHKRKGGEGAYRAMIAHVQDGGVLCMTPDGPRGPRMRASRGAARLGRQTGAPTLCVGISVRPRIVAKSWDRLILPLPFGRGAVVWDGLLPAPDPDAGPEAVERARAAMEAHLIAATARADTLAGAPIIAPAAQAGGGAA